MSLVRFSTQSSTARWTSRLEVLLLKFIFSTMLEFASMLARYPAMVTLLAVPGSPTKRQDLPCPRVMLRSQVERTVSTVGTRTFENLTSSVLSYSGTRLFQETQLFFFTSKK